MRLLTITDQGILKKLGDYNPLPFSVASNPNLSPDTRSDDALNILSVILPFINQCPHLTPTLDVHFEDKTCVSIAKELFAFYAWDM